MNASALRKLNHVASRLLATLVLACTALPAFAQGDGVPGLQFHAPDLAAAAPAPLSGSNLPLAHKVRLGVPPALTGDASANAPKLSVELGYGRSPPPLLGSAGLGSLPEEFWGRTDQRAVKANLNLGF